MRYITHGQCNGRSRFCKPCNPEMYLVGTDKNSRRQQQRVPFVSRDLRRPVQIAKVWRRKCHWRCTSAMSTVLWRRGLLPLCHWKNAGNSSKHAILGATQIPFAAHLVALLDQGHGLLDRFLITFLKCSRPTPTQTSQAIEALKESGLSSVEDIFVEIARLHLSRSTYTLDQEATETVNTINEQFKAEVNEAILEGTSPPKTKKIDIILCVAAALHILNHVTAELLQGRQPTQPADEIEKSTLLCAIEWIRKLGWIAERNFCRGKRYELFLP